MTDQPKPDDYGPPLDQPEPVDDPGTPAARHVAPASSFDVQSLTLGEISDIEDLSDQPIGALADDAAPKGKALSALAYIIKRRDDPAFTFSKARLLTMTEVSELTKDLAADNPKE